MHPVLGQACLQGVEALEEVGLLIRHHHERWDGKGYPDGISGDAIPLGSRIIAVANTFQKLTARKTRLADELHLREEAKKALTAGSGTLYDPAVVQVFIDSLAAQTRRLEQDMALMEIPIEQLKEGMVLADDLLAPNGLLLVPAGEPMNGQVLRRVHNFMGMGGMNKLLRVFVPHEIKERETRRLERAAKEAEEEVLEKHRETVLVADDNNVTRRLLNEVLVGAGYRVHMASTGAKAMELLTRERPELLILDLALPDVDGLQLLRHVKNDPSQKNVPVIVCTARKERSVLVDVIRAGAADVVLKPFSSATVVQKVWRCLESPQTTMADRLREEAAKKTASDPRMKAST